MLGGAEAEEGASALGATHAEVVPHVVGPDDVAVVAQDLEAEPRVEREGALEIRSVHHEVEEGLHLPRLRSVSAHRPLLLRSGSRPRSSRDGAVLASADRARSGRVGAGGAPLILDIFSELQRALPPGQVADAAFEGRILEDAIEQAKLADALGFGCWWTVEHHGATEFSYSSSPEMMLAVLAQHTERIHLGHSGVLAPFNINHPLRVAERAAFLDQVSGGRLELGLARSGGTEWEAFEVDPDSGTRYAGYILVLKKGEEILAEAATAGMKKRVEPLLKKTKK